MKNNLRTFGFMLLCSVFVFLLPSCSTSISDGVESSNNALAIKINTGSPSDSKIYKSLSRAATPYNDGQDDYEIIITVKASGYSDKKSAFSVPGEPVSFTFKNVPVGVEVTATCEVKLGSIIVYKDTQSAITDVDGTVIELDLSKQLKDQIIVNQSNLANLKSLIQLCETVNSPNGPTPPVVIFEDYTGDLNNIVQYLDTTKPCALNFANIGRNTFTDSNDLEIAYAQGSASVILPSNSTIQLTATADGSGNLSINDSNLQQAFSLAGTASDVTVEFKYNGDSATTLPQSMVTTINNKKGSTAFGGKLKLTGNIEIDGNSSNSLVMILPLLGSSTVKIKNTDVADYANVITQIELSNVNVAPFIIEINTNQSVPNYNNGNTQVKNITRIEFRGSATNVKLEGNAFKNWINLAGTVTIPAYVTEIRDHAFYLTNCSLSFADTTTKWNKLGANDSIGAELNPSSISRTTIDNNSIKKQS